jgi:Fe-S cluster biogenesis protein NfuA
MGDEPARLDDPAAERFDDTAIRQRLTDLDELLDRVEQIPGPAGELALEAVSALAEVYGEALARALALAEPSAFVADELLGHLLVLHGIHPDPVERRVVRALEEMAPAVRERGGEVELAGLDDGVARVRLTVSGCGAAGVEEEVRTAVLAVAPELDEVRRETPPRDAAFVPLDSLLQRPSVLGPAGVGP